MVVVDNLVQKGLLHSFCCGWGVLEQKCGLV